jgi:uncharacterized SAM-binding protein YcdF (DUF218 family)
VNEADTAARRKRRPLRDRASRRRRFLLAAAFAGLAAAVWCGTLYTLIVRYDGEPGRGSGGRAEVGIVLGAALWNDRPSPGLRERLDLALAAYREGRFSYFLVTGGLDRNGATLTEAQGMKRYLLEQGVPDAAIVTENESTSTYENLRNARRIMDERGWDTALIFTHQFHGFRAASIARALGYDPVQVRTVESRVLNEPYHRAREVLAFTKWIADWLLLHGR